MAANSSGESCTQRDFSNVSLYDKMMYGGIGYGTFCVPKELPNYIILVIFPPLYVFIKEMQSGFKRVDRIIINFILTSCFYFPGLLHGLTVLRCGSLRDTNGGPAVCEGSPTTSST